MTRNLIPEVKEKVQRPFEVKLRETLEVIDHHFIEFKSNEVCVAFSGGKDSLVVLDLVRHNYPDVAVMFGDTGVEFPETKRYVLDLRRQWDLNLVITKPDKYNFWDCVNLFGWPDIRYRSHAHCCYYLKERPAKLAIRSNSWGAMFTGETASESYNRMMTAKSKGICFHHSKFKCCKVRPILWWTEAEVWAYIRALGLPYNPLYDCGTQRVGCMMCTAYLGWESQLRRLNPKMYALVKKRKDHQGVMTGILR